MGQKQLTEESSTKPSSEQIVTLAFQYYLERGADPGREEEDWLRAERTLKEEPRTQKQHPLVSP